MINYAWMAMAAFLTAAMVMVGATAAGGYLGYRFSQPQTIHVYIDRPMPKELGK
jgi:hypothetical protein